MLFIDFLYLVCCQFYKKREKDSYKSSGLILLAGVFFFNGLGLIFIFSYGLKILSSNQSYMWEVIAAVTYLVIILPLLYFRYYRKTSYDAILVKANSLSEKTKAFFYLTSLVYVLFSYAAVVAYAFYRGGMVNGWW